jgi:hypothetical protein
MWRVGGLVVGRDAGFGRWGILAEPDMTTRTVNLTRRSLREDTTFVQFFRAAREWLVGSAIEERAKVRIPNQENLIAEA